MQHVITGTCQLVRHRLDGNDAMLARPFALVPAADRRVETHGVVGRFRERPAQVAVAALAVAVSLPFAVG